LTVSTSII